MKQRQTNAAKVKKVAAPAKKNALITEAELKQFVNNRGSELILLSVATQKWEDKPLEEDRLGIAGARCKVPIVISYLGKIKNDHVISKASYFWTVGRELNTTEVSKLIYSEEDAPQFNQDLTDALTLCYESFKEKFGEDGAETIYRGVATAQWCADQIGKAEDKTATAMRIAEKVQNMSNSIYTKIVTAKTNKKKHVTRDLVIKTALDQMMTA